MPLWRGDDSSIAQQIILVNGFSVAHCRVVSRTVALLALIPRMQTRFVNRRTMLMAGLQWFAETGVIRVMQMA